MAKILSVVAPRGFQEIEFLESKRALEERGFEVVMASHERVAIDRQGIVYDPELLLNEVRPTDFAALLFVGGPGSSSLFDDAVCHDLAREFYDSGKPTAAICAAPVILGRAGLLDGRKTTCFPGSVEDLKGSGADYTGARVEKDGLLITADGPGSAYDFGVVVADALK